MKQEWLKKEVGNRNLILFFAGWSCEGRQFENIFDFEDSNILMFSDYRTICPLEIDFDSYTSLSVIGWSFGVFIASNITRLFADKDSKFKFESKNHCNISINGTPEPIDDLYGIPTKGFELTLASIRRGGMQRFNSRISKGVESKFISTTRAIDSLVDELNMLYVLTKEGCKGIWESRDVENWEVEQLKWDYSIISNGDLIFPPQNQSNFWNKNSIFAPILIDAPHFAFTDECVDKIREILKIDR